jgi:hypothetical protein
MPVGIEIPGNQKLLPFGVEELELPTSTGAENLGTTGAAGRLELGVALGSRVSATSSGSAPSRDAPSNRSAATIVF